MYAAVKKRSESSVLLNVLRSGKSRLPRAASAHCKSRKVKKNGIRGNGHRARVGHRSQGKCWVW